MKPILALLVLVIAIAAGGYFLLVSGTGSAGTGEATVPVEHKPDNASKAADVQVGPTGDTRDGRVVQRDPERIVTPAESYPQGLEGMVLSSAGGAVAGAEIFLLHGMAPTDLMQVLAVNAGRMPLPRVAAQGTTGPGGTFHLESPVTEGQAGFDLRIKAAGHVVYQQTLRISPNRWEKLPTITLEKGRTLQGMVRDKTTKAAIAGATVRAKPMGSSFFVPTPGHEDGIESTCDASGRYTLGGLAKGPLEIVAFARGYGRVMRADVQFADSEQVRTEDLELDKGYEIDGWVADADNVPIVRAEVTAVPFAQQSAALVTTYSDKDGRFALLGLAEGSYTLTAKAKGYFSGSGDRKGIKAGDKDVAIVLEKQASIKVRVVAKSGRPLSAYYLEVMRTFEGQEHYGKSDVDAVQVRGAKNGEYELGGINPDPNPYVLQVEADGFAKTYSKPFAIAEGQRHPQPVEVTMNEGATLTGTVSDETGQPIAGASVVTLDDTHMDNPLTDIFGAFMPVRITKSTAVTDANGRFELERLTPCKYQLKFDHPEHSRAYRKGFAVEDGQKLDTGVTKLEQGGQLSGKVFKAGQPVVAAKVTVSSAGGEGSAPIFESAFTDTNGSFTFARRLPAGKYEVHAQRTDHQNPFQAIVDIQESKQEVHLTRGPQSVTIHMKQR